MPSVYKRIKQAQNDASWTHALITFYQRGPQGQALPKTKSTLVVHKNNLAAYLKSHEISILTPFTRLAKGRKLNIHHHPRYADISIVPGTINKDKEEFECSTERWRVLPAQEQASLRMVGNVSSAKATRELLRTLSLRGEQNV